MQRRTVELAWGPVSYLEWGSPGSGEEVVLLHGGGVDNASLSFGALGPALAAAGHHVVAPDHPGYGHSPAAPWASTTDHLARYVDAFIAAVGVGDRYVLGGISLGGVLSLRRALDRPEGLRAVVLMGSYGLMPLMGRGRTARLQHLLTWASVHSGLLDALTPATLRSRPLMTAALRASVRAPGSLTDALMDEVMDAAALPDASRAFGQWQRSECLLRGARTDLTGRLARLDVPVLLVHGSRDVGVPVERAREAARLIPHARLLEVEGAGHWVQRDRPDTVNPAVVEFLAGLAA